MALIVYRANYWVEDLYIRELTVISQVDAISSGKIDKYKNSGDKIYSKFQYGDSYWFNKFFLITKT